MAEVLGTAKIVLTGDTSDLTLAYNRAEEHQRGLGKAAEAEAAKMTAAQRRVIEAFDRRIAKTGLTREAALAFDIQTRTSGQVQQALLAKLQANTKAIDDQARAMQNHGNVAQKNVNAINQYGLTQKQQTAAMRQVPAQLTDIVVSLQGGQNPLTVLLQQGGQLRDVFGGAVPAVRALAGQLTALISTGTVVAGVLAAVGVAIMQGEDRINGFNRALILTGQQGRMSADDLQAMTGELDKISGVTSRQAAEALTGVVSTGRIAASQYELIAQAAAVMQDATGKAMQETIDEYAQIARDPVNAILKLNESENFLTESVYERIRALQEAGDIEGAAAAATEARAQSQIQRAAEVVESLGLLSGAWHSVKQNTGEAWDEAVNYFADLDRKAKDAAGTIRNLWHEFKNSSGAGRQVFNLIEQGIASAAGPVGGRMFADFLYPNKGKPAAGKPTEPPIDSNAQRQLDALLAGNRSREERQRLEEQQIVNLYKQVGVSKEDKRVQDALAESRKRYQESLPKGRSNAGAARSLANAEASAAIDAIKNQEEEQRSAIRNTTQILQAQYSARLVTVSDYYAQQRRLVEGDTRAQVESLEKQLAYLRQRGVAGKDAVNVGKQIADVETKLSQVRADGATKLEVLSIQQQDAVNRQQLALRSYTEALDSENTALQMNADAMLRRIMMGEEAAAQEQRLAEIRERFAERQRDLSMELAQNNDQAAYDAKLAALQNWMDEQVRITEQGYARMKAAQGDWLNGIRAGTADWMSKVSDVASQTAAITTRTLDGAAESFANLAISGKANVRSLLIDIGTEITKFLAKKAIMQFLQAFGSYLIGGGASMSTTQAANINAGNFVGPRAKGGAFYGDAEFFAKGGAFTNSIVSQATPFTFAKGGKFGVMGEKGPEAIMPLERDSAGRLGVIAMGGAAGGPPQVGVVVNIDASGRATTDTKSSGIDPSQARAMGDSIRQVVSDEIDRYLRPGGKLWAQSTGGR